MAQENNPFSPPQAEVDDVAVGGPALAGRGVRLVAVLIDVAIQLAVVWVVSLVLGLDLMDPDPSLGQLAIGFVVGIIIFLALQGWLLVTQGQTIGKKLMGVRIVRSDGSRVDPARLLGLRYALVWLLTTVPVAGVIFALVDSLMIFRESRKCLHDGIADTIVVVA